MPFRLGERWPGRAKIQFTTSAEMPSLIYRACLATGVVSNTRYCQLALAEALGRDLGIPVETVIAGLPEPRGPARHLFDPDQHTMSRYGIAAVHGGGVVRIGPANTIEDVR